LKVRFLGVPLEHLDQLIDQEEIVMINVQTFKMEEFGHTDGSTSVEKVLTGGWGVQIKSSKDIFQFVDDKDDEFDAKEKKEYSDKVRDRFR
jgi:hypothetical protein